MLSEKIRRYLVQNELYIDDDDERYVQVMVDLEIDLKSAFAEFHLKTNSITFQGRLSSLYNICWFAIHSSYKEQVLSFQKNLMIPKEYLPLDAFEAEGGFFYNTKNDAVVEIELGEKLIHFQAGIIDTQWKSFNAFLEWYFELV